jgi:hypothetical protein
MREPVRTERPILIWLPRPEDKYSWGWIAWAGVSAAGFAALEGHAVRTGKFDRTLSVHSRRLLGIRPRKRWHVAGRLVFAGGCLWLAQHVALAPDEYLRLRRYINMVEEPCRTS